MILMSSWHSWMFYLMFMACCFYFYFCGNFNFTIVMAILMFFMCILKFNAIVVHFIMGGWESIYCVQLMFSPISTYITFRFDYYSDIMQMILYMISFSVIIFSCWYMEDGGNSDFFIFIIVAFVCSMDFLCISSSMICMYIAWEMLGVISMLLINHWKSRRDSYISGFMAFFYNRIGDSGLLFCVTIFVMFHDTQMFNFFSVNYDFFSTIFFMFVILSCMVKSCQIFFYPWLKFAMEGPTPVSSLLHSSTMVVAGVYVMCTAMSIFVVDYSSYIKIFMACLGAVTSLYGSFVSFLQHDMKKLCAYSTMSHLGLMFLSIALSNITFVFFHLFVHACCKAMIFMCVGTYQHLTHSQDMRHIIGIGWSTPFLSSSLFICSVGLSGMPLFFVWWSKHMIIDFISEFTYFNYFIFIIFFFSSFFSFAYCIKVLVFMIFCNSYNKYIFKSYNSYYVFSTITWCSLLSYASFFSSCWGFYFFSMSYQTPCWEDWFGIVASYIIFFMMVALVLCTFNFNKLMKFFSYGVHNYSAWIMWFSYNMYKNMSMIETYILWIYKLVSNYFIWMFSKFSMPSRFASVDTSFIFFMIVFLWFIMLCF